MWLLLLLVKDIAEGKPEKMTPMMKVISVLVPSQMLKYFNLENMPNLKTKKDFKDYDFLELTYLANLIYLHKAKDYSLYELLELVDEERIRIYEKLSSDLEKVEDEDQCKYNMFYQLNSRLVEVVLRDVHDAQKNISKISERDLTCLKQHLTEDKTIPNRESLLSQLESILSTRTTLANQESTTSRKVIFVTPVMKELMNNLSSRAKRYFTSEKLEELQEMKILNQFTFWELTYLANLIYIDTNEDEDFLDEFLKEVDVERVLKFEPLSERLIYAELDEGCQYNMFFNMDIKLLIISIGYAKDSKRPISKMTDHDLDCLEERAEDNEYDDIDLLDKVQSLKSVLRPPRIYSTTLGKKNTENSTKIPTERSTKGQTEEPTDEPTKEPIKEPTEEPTEKPTKRPTERLTERPVEEPTKRPTERLTERPTEEPTERLPESLTEIQITVEEQTIQHHKPLVLEIQTETKRCKKSCFIWRLIRKNKVLSSLTIVGIIAFIIFGIIRSLQAISTTFKENLIEDKTETTATNEIIIPSESELANTSEYNTGSIGKLDLMQVFPWIILALLVFFTLVLLIGYSMTKKDLRKSVPNKKSNTYSSEKKSKTWDPSPNRNSLTTGKTV